MKRIVDPAKAVIVTVGDAVHPLRDDEPFTFGRSEDCTVFGR